MIFMWPLLVGRVHKNVSQPNQRVKFIELSWMIIDPEVLSSNKSTFKDFDSGFESQQVVRQSRNIIRE